MPQFSADDNFNCGDTWPVGSFRVKEADGLIGDIIEGFDVPCWPELTGRGAEEELVGFWLKLYIDWDVQASAAAIDEALWRRPGLAALLARFQNQPLPLIKGQMIGPSTLIWALNRAEYPVVDRRRVLDFIYQAYIRQAYLLAKVGYRVIVSFDEPCVSQDSTAVYLWQDFFDKPQLDDQFGIALHCCGTPKAEWLQLPWHVVHFDMRPLAVAMSVDKALWNEAWKTFFSRGSWLAAGIVSGRMTGAGRDDLMNLEALEELFAEYGHQRILLSTTCGLDARNPASVREKINQLTLASRHFLSNRKSH